MKMSKTRILTECAMMIALATGLSLVKLIEMPYGGSVTAASMLPIVLLAYRHGTKYGLLSGLVYGVLQQLLGLNTLSYATSWVSVVAIILLDYVIAFAVIGLAGLVRRAPMRQGLALGVGAALASVLRYLCHVVSGATVWAGLSIPDEAAMLYSLSYNATYMLPETIILACAAVYVGSLIDFRSIGLRPIVAHAATSEERRTSVIYAVCGLLCTVCTGVITVLLFPHLQGESGAFDFSGITGAPWVPILVCLGVLLLAAATVFVLYMRKSVKARGTV